MATDNFPIEFGGSQNDLLFSTKERDFSTGLDYFGFRYYDAVLGKFITRDPSGYPDGSNNYLYVKNNPINAIDPLGLSMWSWVKSKVKSAAASVKRKVTSTAKAAVRMADKALIVSANVAAGFGDTISGGLTEIARNKMNINDVVNKNSAAYKGGEVGGKVVDAAMTVTGVAGAAKALAKEGIKQTVKVTAKEMGKDAVTSNAATAVTEAGVRAGVIDKATGELVNAGIEKVASKGKKTKVADTKSGGGTSSGAKTMRKAQAPDAKVKEGTYEFDELGRDGKVRRYVGQSNDVERRLKEHKKTKNIVDGSVEKKSMPNSSKLEREVAEHKQIQKHTGGVRAKDSDKVSNKVDPIGKARRKKLKIPEPKRKKK